MIPIKLKISAFGPFLKEQTIDFTKFDSDKIFLISGETGSGKTTIFDAIAVALFGQSSGFTRQSDSFKSCFASDEDLCFVEFEFCIHQKYYTILRQPIQMVKKSTGSVVRQGSSATLTFEDGKIISGTDNVDKYIEQLIGINVEQFKKIVMLPQGEFKRFLLDDSAEKQKILRKIFGTKILNDFTDKLHDNEGEYKAKLIAIQNEQNAYCNSIFCENDELFDAISAPQKDIKNILTILKNRNKMTSSLILSSKKDIEKLRNRVQDINLPYHQQINEKFLQRARLLNEIETLEMQKNDILLKKSQYNLLVKIKDILPTYNQKINVDKQIILQENILGNYKNDYENAEINLQKAIEIEKIASQNYEKTNIIILQIEKLSAQLNRLDEIKNSKNDLKNVESELVKLSENLNSYQDFLEYINFFQEKSHNIEIVEQLNIAVENLDFYKLRLNEYVHEKDTYENIFHMYLDGQAASIAQNLVKDQACPVCGSLEHPNPARFIQEKITDIRLEQEKTIYESATKNLQIIKSTCQQNISNILMITVEEIDADFFINDILLMKKNITDEIEKIEEKMSEIILDEKLMKISPLPKTQIIEKRISEISQDIAVAKQRQINLNEKIQSLIENLSEKTFDDVMIKNKITELQISIETYKNQEQMAKKSLETARLTYERIDEAINQTTLQVEKLKNNLEILSQSFKESLSNINLSISDFISHSNEIDKIFEILQVITDYENSVKNKNELLVTLNSELDGKVAVKLDDLQQEYDELQREITAKNDIFVSISGDYANNKNIYEQLKITNEKYDIANEKYIKFNRLYEIASGKFSDRINFERYVLAAYFDEVVKSANFRLEQMTASRYTLMRRTEKEKGNTSSGLALAVFDAYNGKIRHVNTLSGGESFKVSLCLALGLSTVISQNSGGIELNTMFIDEGFGTLDPESLDSAIDCLNELKLDGRYIGIISHVNELKEKIPAKILVKQTTNGSYIEM